MAQITFEKEPDEGIKQEVQTGWDFLTIHRIYPDLPLKFGCKRGECGVCAFKVKHGMENLTKKTPEEVSTLAKKNLPAECRLGCQCAINGDVTISLPCPRTDQ